MFKPTIFVGSSVESIDFAYAIQTNLEHKLEVTVWDQGVFSISGNSLDSLISATYKFDFAAFVFAPDDVTNLRKENLRTVRDNVVFELGLFIGALGKERCFIVAPRNEDLHIPTDLIGVTPATFDPNRSDGNLRAALGPACNSIVQIARTLGGRAGIEKESSVNTRLLDGISDPNDCINILQSWLGSIKDITTTVIRYDAVDKNLGLVAGSSKLYIEKAAARWSLVAANIGKDTITFKSLAF